MQHDQGREREYCLVGLNDELNGKRIPLRDGATIGRDCAADVFLPDPAIRRHQCRIRLTAAACELHQLGDGQLAQVNGSFVQSAELKVGDVLQLGRFQLRVDQQQATSDVGGTPRKTFAPEQGAPAGPVPYCRPNQGSILAARLRITQPGDRLPDVADWLRERCTRIIREAGGRCVGDDPLYWHAYWKNSDDQDQTQVCAVRAGLACRQLEFLGTGLGGTVQWVAAVASGDFYTAKGRRGDLLWGEAVERASVLAATQPAGILPVDNLSQEHPWLRLVGTSPGWTPREDTVVGVRLAAGGRRQRYLIAIPVQLSLARFRIVALLAGCSHDPQTCLTALSVLCRDPLEGAETYSLCRDTGDVSDLTCSKCQPATESGGFRAELLTRLTPETLFASLGISLAEEAPCWRQPLQAA